MADGRSRSGRPPDLDGDARQLRLVKWRAAGHSLNALAARFAMSKARVRQLTEQVLADDLAYSTATEPVAAQEPGAVVRAAYWPTRKQHGGVDAG